MAKLAEVRIMIRRIRLIVALITALIGFASLPAVAQSGRVFYIDYAGGSNSNPGTKASPWKTQPFMNHSAACDGGRGPSYAHQAGDRFIFKGAVTWPASCFEIYISVGGSAGNPDYYGVDQTWYSGGSWTRPLFDFNYQVPGLGNHAIATTGAANFTAGVPYLTFDNLEIAHLNSYPSASDLTTSAAIVLGGSFSWDAAPGTTVENCYIHDWVSTTNQIYNNTILSYATIYGAALVTNTETSDANGYYYVGGVRQNEVSSGGCAGCGEMANSKIHDGWIGCSACGSVHDSEFYNIFGGVDVGIHTHVIYDDALSAQSTYAVYNNAVHDTYAGLITDLFYHTAIYNNVFWNNQNNAGISIYHCANGAGTYSPCGDKTSQVGYVLNNTIDMTNGSGACYRWDEVDGVQGMGTLYFQNNICIPAAGAVGGFNVATQHVSNNYTMSPSEASSYGFTSAQKYAPSSSDPHVTGQGANLSSLATASLASLGFDTAGAPWSRGSYVPRSTSWDLGAYVVAASQSQSSDSKPNPPTNLTATLQ
jgi:hypothetical protein